MRGSPPDWFRSERHHERSGYRLAALTLGYGILLCLILVVGGLRLALAPTNGPSVRAAVVSFPKDMFTPGEVTRIVQGRINANERRLMEEKLERLHDWFLESIRRERVRVFSW